MFARIDEDNAKEAVRSFYDLHPYPAVDDLDEYRRQWQDEDRRLPNALAAPALPGRSARPGGFIVPPKCSP